MWNLGILLGIISFIIFVVLNGNFSYKKMGLIGIGIGIFCWTPIGIDYFLIKEFVKDTNSFQWIKSDWSGFLGSYLGGGISGVITLTGVWWQVTKNDKKEKREKTIGVLKGILYSINRNLETDNLKLIKFKSFQVLDYYYDGVIYSKFYDDYIYEIFPEVIKENYKIIFELDFGKKIIDLNENIEEFNKNYKFLALDLGERKCILEKIEEILKGYNQKSTIDLKIQNSQINYRKIINIIEEIKVLSDKTNASEFFESDKEIIKLGEKLNKKIFELLNHITSFKDEELKKLGNKLCPYFIAEKIILNENIFKIIEEMEKLKEKIEDEIKRLENQ